MNTQNELKTDENTADILNKKGQSRIEKLEKIKATYKNGLKWILLGILTGAVVGSISAFFAHGIVLASAFRVKHPQLLFALPFAGLLLVFAYSILSDKNCRWKWHP